MFKIKQGAFVTINSLLAITLMTICSSAFAEDAKFEPLKIKESPECAEIAKSCESAGYEVGAHKINNKGLWSDCVGMLSKGKEVEGIDMTSATNKVAAKKCIDFANKRTAEIRKERKERLAKEKAEQEAKAKAEQEAKEKAEQEATEKEKSTTPSPTTAPSTSTSHSN